jgi:hypothetical protein
LGHSELLPWARGESFPAAWNVAAGVVTAVTFRAEYWEVGGDVLDLTNLAGLLVDGLNVNVALTGTVAFSPKVPEPTTGLLVGVASLLGLALCRWLS